MIRPTALLKRLLTLVCCLALPHCEERTTPGDASVPDNDPVDTWQIDNAATLAANQGQIARQLEGLPEAREKLDPATDTGKDVGTFKKKVTEPIRIQFHET